MGKNKETENFGILSWGGGGLERGLGDKSQKIRIGG
jgi:hypothetical protein